MMKGMTDGGSDQRERLGRLIAERREELRLSVSQAAARARVDRGTWASAEAGNRQLARTKWRGIEDALGWRPGSLEAILAGLEPTLAGPVIPLDRSATSSVGSFDLAREVRRIRSLRIPAATKLEMVTALIDLYAEVQAEPVEPGARSAG